MAAERRALTPEEQTAAAQLLYERTDRHQALVRAVAEQAGPATFHEDAAAYDLIVDGGDPEALVLIEAKSISDDASAQVRAAVGQLLYYEYFSVPAVLPDRAVRKLVVVDGPVPEELAEFLQAEGLGLIELVDDTFHPRNDIGTAIAGDLFP